MDKMIIILFIVVFNFTWLIGSLVFEKQIRQRVKLNLDTYFYVCRIVATLVAVKFMVLIVAGVVEYFQGGL